MNIKEFNITEKPFKTTLMFELYEGSDYDKKAHRILKKDKHLFADSKFDNEVFYYDITNKMSFRKYMAAGLNQKKLFYLIERLIDVELCFRASGVDSRYMMYDADLILVDKDTEEITFIYVPATDHGLISRPLKPFIKEVLANAVYDEMENLDYVGRLITYVNKHKVLEVDELPAVLEDIRNSQKNLSRITEKGAVELAKAAAVIDAVSENVEPDNVPEAVMPTPVEPEAVMPETDAVSIDVNDVSISGLEGFEEPSVENVDENISLLIEEPVVEETPAMRAVEEAAAASVKADEIPEFEPVLDKKPEEEAVTQPEDVKPEKEKTSEVLLVEEVPAEEVKAPVHMAARDVPVQEVPVMTKKYPYLVRSKNQEIITIDKDEFKLGKIAGADYLLSDNPAVSRMHAIIHNVDNTYYICDNYSTNATYLNGERLEPGKNYLLMNGVKVRLANDEFTYICEE